MRVLFLADQLASDPRSHSERHPGGAELTDEAAIRACPWPIEVYRMTDTSLPALRRFDVIIVANADLAPAPVLEAVAGTGRHVLFEHDLRVCEWRGNFPACGDPAHQIAQRCDCAHLRFRPLLGRALGLIFLSERQRLAYHANPSFTPGRQLVLGCSLFSTELLGRIETLARTTRKRGVTSIPGAHGEFKGRALALDHCRRHAWPVVEIRDLPYDVALAQMAATERFVFLPFGVEASGRMPIEARLLGCTVTVNGQLGVTGERLWSAGAADALALLSDGPARFWRLVEWLAEGRPTPYPDPGPPPHVERELGTLREVAGARLSERVARLVEHRETVQPWR